MTTFTLTDLGNRSGEVVEAAFNGPVEITKRGKRKFVLLTAEQFDRLTHRSTQDAPIREDEFIAGVDIAAQGSAHDD